MKFLQNVIFGFLLIGLVNLFGCDANRAAREHARAEQEERARRDTETGNKAITGMNQRIFGKKTGAGEDPKKGPEVSVGSETKK